MATLSRTDPKHMYSWWWVSHISPKNSKWLQENLTDMDSKVKQMIKVIEVDEDSFARRAEMYYKKRPELMKLVEEFYRAYRALAERYDHATGVIRQAHKTMSEAFPNQVPGLESDEGPFGSANDSDHFTPEMSAAVRASGDLDESQKGGIGLSPSDFHSTERSGPFVSRATPFGKFAEGRSRRALNFPGADKKGVQTQKNETDPHMAQGHSDSERIERYEKDIQALKDSLAKLEAEKEAGLLQYQESMQRLSNLESEVLRAQEDSRGFHEQASKAEAEVQSLRESLSSVEGEREASLHRYQQCLDKISGLESNVSRFQEDAISLEKRACEAKKESQVLTVELAQLKAEKEADLAKYMEALERIGSLENKLSLAEDEASVAGKRADSAEKEVAALKEALARITEEKEAYALRYQQSLEKIASLENEIAFSREEIAKLRDEMDHEIVKLKGVEEQCLHLERSNKSMQTELDSVLIKLGFQNQELSEKQKELGRLWTCIQEERVRFVEAETAFKTLQGLHSQTQEELRSVAAELQKRVQLLKEMEIHSQGLEGELQKFRDENQSLNELNVSSAVSIKSLQDDILNLKEGKAKLEEDLELRLDQRNALQQEIYCLKEELNSLNKKHGALLEQMEAVGFQPECFTSSVQDLQDENSKLKESCHSSRAEISVLLEKLNVMEQLIEKKAVLEQSLSELSSELEDARGKVKALEESCQLLMIEKSTALTEKAALISQLTITTENLEKLSERNTLLENSLFDANAELEALRKKSKDLEGSCRLLTDEKSVLVDERQVLELKLETAHQTLQELEKKHRDLEQSYVGMEEERKSTLKQMEDLRILLAAEKEEREHSTHSSRMQMAKMEDKICMLQEMVEQTRGELGEELDEAVSAQFEIFILRNSLQDLRETNSSLLKKCEKLLETSRLSEKLISQLEYENFEQQEEVGFLSDQIKRLRVGMFQLLKVLEVDLDHVFEDNIDDDKLILHRILVKLDDTRNSLCRALDENEKLVIEKSVLLTLLGQLKHQVGDLKTVIDTLQQDFRTRNDQLSSLQRDMLRLLQSNEELLLRIREGNHKEDLLASEMQGLREKLQETQGVCRCLEKENSRMQEEKQKLEDENSCLVSDVVTLDTLSLVFKDSISQLIDNMSKLGDENSVLQDKLRTVEGLLGEHQTENTTLKASLEEYVDELNDARAIIANGKDMLSRKVIELIMEVEAAKDDQQRQIHELSGRYDEQGRESACLRESMQDLDAEIARIREKYNESRRVVKKGRDETALWETVAGTFFTELQATSVREALYREKFNELTREYECLEERSYADGLVVEQLREIVGSLKGENGEMKARWAGYVPAMESLRSSVASLERHVAPSEVDDDKDSSHSHRSKDGAEATAASPNDFTALQDIAARITAVENKVIETKKLAEERALRSLRSLSSRSLRRSGRTSRRFSPESTEDRPKPAPETHETGGELLMKDIVLDQASESVSSHWKNKKPAYNTGSGDQILELWKTVEPDPRDIHAKELRIDSLEILTRFSGSNDFESDHKVLERLSSDVQKLTNLQITVQDLKQKVSTVETAATAKSKAAEYTTVKDQLGDAETTITKLLDVNGRLVRNVEDRSSDSSHRPTSSSIGGSSDVGGSGRRRRVSEQARRCSEKIGRLQVEVQKIQFLLLKLDGGSKTSRGGGARGVDRDRKVVLRDYLYGAARTPRRRKKVQFCACVQPPTSGD